MENRVGPNGFWTLLLSLLIIIFTLGLSLLWSLGWTLLQALKASVHTLQPAIYWVPGKRLEKGGVDADFTDRLNRVAVLWQQAPAATYVLGGFTNTSGISEAAAGRDILLQQGVDDSMITLEQRSRHTLENLQFAHQMREAEQSVALVSNRYHLPRLGLMASSLGIDHQLVAAESGLRLSPATWLRWLMEAFYNHWFYIACRCAGKSIRNL